MPGSIIVAFPDPGTLLGVRGIDVLLDGETVGTTRFGESTVIACTPGPHKVQAVLHAFVRRDSNALDVTVDEDAPARVEGVYSRMFGSIELKRT